MRTSELNIKINKSITLHGNLSLTEDPGALVIFSHGSGSGRFSTRNRKVAGVLNEKKIATLLVDLLTEREDAIYQNRFDIGLLTERLAAVTEYACGLPELRGLPVGYFGASTGAASAIRAAVRIPSLVRAIVSRGGRPDLAEDALDKVNVPTLLIIGSLDTEVLALNRDAFARLSCEKDLQVISGATHLFEEPGKMDEVADLAARWFRKHLVFNLKIK